MDTPPKLTPTGKPSRRLPPAHEREVTPVKVETWYRVFLRVLRLTGKPTSAAKACGRTLQHCYRCRAIHPEFRERWQKALIGHRAMRLHAAEREAYRRGVRGWKEPVYQSGVKVGYKRKYSDALLVKVLESEAPAKYRKNFDGETPRGQTMVNVTMQSLMLTDPQVAELASRAAEVLAAPQPGQLATLGEHGYVERLTDARVIEVETADEAESAGSIQGPPTADPNS